jgi:(p)ppGpp synthase/HD superfamily hydrolase
MIYTEKTKRAMQIAFDAHMRQVDKAGVPYIFHPIHVAEQMETEEECIVALLHDVVEDTNITFEDLDKEFSSVVIEALKLMTHDKSVPYSDYVKRIKNNPIARKVKLADLNHNSDETRICNLSSEDIERIKKYHSAIMILSS